MIRFKHVNQGLNFRYAPALIVCMLCFYFSYHLMQGQHSLWSYFSNQTLISEKQETLKTQSEAIATLQSKVVKLRTATLDKDFLEERARYLLGYMSEEELMLLQ